MLNRLWSHCTQNFCTAISWGYLQWAKATCYRKFGLSFLYSWYFNFTNLLVYKTFANSCSFNNSNYAVLLFLGYQRVLTDAPKDQSYSYLRKTRIDAVDSMWRTAFVVKCLGLAQPYVYIDKVVLSYSMYFFTRHQDRNGCFSQICIY